MAARKKTSTSDSTGADRDLAAEALAQARAALAAYEHRLSDSAERTEGRVAHYRDDVKAAVRKANTDDALVLRKVDAALGASQKERAARSRHTRRLPTTCSPTLPRSRRSSVRSDVPATFAACSLRLEAADRPGLVVVRVAIAIGSEPTEQIGPLIGDRAAVEQLVGAFLDRRVRGVIRTARARRDDGSGRQCAALRRHFAVRDRVRSRNRALSARKITCCGDAGEANVTSGPDNDDVPAAAGQRLSICLLGDFRVRDGDRDVALPESTWRLVAFLALAGRPVSRRYAAHTLWLDKPERRAEANLRSVLWRLHRTGLRIVRTEGQLVALADDVTVDVTAVRAIAGRFWKAAADLEMLDLDVDALLDVDLLPDWYDDFVEVERERLRQLVLYVYEAVAGELGRRGDVGHALDLAFRAVAAAPWRESSHRLVMQLHIADGNIAEAVRHYRQLEQMLDSELGVRPSDVTSELVAPFLVGGSPTGARAASRRTPSGSAGTRTPGRRDHLPSH